MFDMARHWWLVALRGIAAVTFGLLAWTWPGITLAALVIAFGVYALVDGFTAFGVAFFDDDARDDRGWLILQGFAGIGAGIGTLAWPDITAVILLALVATWAIVVGVLQIATAVQARHEIEGEGWAMLAGAMAVLFGILLLVWPGEGALALAWLIGLAAVTFGITQLVDSGRLFRLRRRASEVGSGDVHAEPAR